MASWKMILKARKDLCKGTCGFCFEKPPSFEFRPGQFANLLIAAANTDPGGATRTLSIASAPHEAELMIATRMRDSGFKRALSALAIGSEVDVQGPFGDFTLLHGTGRPAVFLAGGIGITPFRSIIRHAIQTQSQQRIFLFYSVRGLGEAAFLGELQEADEFNSHFKLVLTVTRPAEIKPGWQGETGYISEAMLRKSLPDLQVPKFYIAGPPAMVTSMSRMLTAARVPDEHIRVEEFAGY
jgi:ferredoxin-NADP reductase